MEEKDDVVEGREWEEEKYTLQATLDQLEEELVKMEIEEEESGDEEEKGNILKFLNRNTKKFNFLFDDGRIKSSNQSSNLQLKR